MTASMIDILFCTPFATVQDQGRDGYRAQGVSLAGAMDAQALALGNALLGNDPAAAGIETSAGPLKIRFGADSCVALTGAMAPARLDGAAIPFNWVTPVRAGQILELAPPEAGMWSYVSVAGGLDVARVLGSRSTDRKIGIGGPCAGAGLSAGLSLATGAVTPERLRVTASLGGYGLSVAPVARADDGARLIRVVPAREYDRFTRAAQDLFWSTPWAVGRESNRMGYRLSGEALTLTEPQSLPSYGLVPGTVQVPASGQPIVQLSEANTCGGYPKMGVVIGADLPALVQARPGEALRFERVDMDAALAARAAAHAQIAAAKDVARKVTTWK